MSKPIISMKLGPRSYAALVNLGNRVAASLAGNLNFATPLVPVANLTAAITDVVSAIAQRGTKSSHGSTADIADLRKKALTLHQLLKSEGQYVQAIAQVASSGDYVLMASIITTSGYDLANVRNPQGILEKVQNFHQFVSRKLNKNQVKLKWKKPLNVTSPGNVKNYKVIRAASNDVTTAVEVAITTKTTFTDMNTTAAAVVWTYWVIACNAGGPGVLSDALVVEVLGA